MLVRNLWCGQFAQVAPDIIPKVNKILPTNTHTRFGKDTTIRLSCRAGDYLLWGGFNGIAEPADNLYSINDLWQLADGDFVTITNRYVDLPPWFDLHPLETSGSLAQRLYGSSISVDQTLGEICDGPNIWRVSVGDRLVWVGKKRSGVEFDNGVLSVITFNEHALVIGEPITLEDGLPGFGGFVQQEQSPESLMLGRRGWEAVKGLGLPHEVNEGRWTLGW